MAKGWCGPGSSKCDGSERRDLQVKSWHLPPSPSACNELSAHKSPIQSVSQSESGIAGLASQDGDNYAVGDFSAQDLARANCNTAAARSRLEKKTGQRKRRQPGLVAKSFQKYMYVGCTQFHRKIPWNEVRSSSKDLNRPVCCWSFVYPAIRCHPVVCKTVNHELPQRSRPSHSHSCNGHFAPELHPSTAVSHFGGMASSFFSGVATLLIAFGFFDPLAKNRPG